MIIFDLDHTLFKTDTFKQDACTVFMKYGMDEDDFWKTFYGSYAPSFAGMGGYYSIDRNLALVDRWGDSKKRHVKKQLLEVMHRRGTAYLFDDVLKTLQALQHEGHKFILLSKGDDEFQRLKVAVSGIEPYFYKMYFVRRDKRPVLSKIIGGESVINVNDHHQELRWAKSIAPTIKNVYIRRSREPIAGLDESTIVIRNLMELQHHL